MTEFITTIAHIIWIYGGSYAAALATASSFFAVFFFFWTRTGERKDKIDPETKKVYLHAIYSVLRYSLIGIIISKVFEVFIVQGIGRSNGVDASIMDIFFSQNGFFIYMLLILIALNSYAMQKGWINFSWALPFAIISYLFLFLHMTSRSTFLDIRGFFQPVTDLLLVDLAIYGIALALGTILFNYFSRKVRGITRETIAAKKAAKKN